MIPSWLNLLSWFSVLTGIASAVIVAVRVVKHPPPMAVMRFVWPVCGLFGGPLLVWFHARYGQGHGDAPFPITVAKGTLHCGAGCTLGDIIAEPLALMLPAILVLFGYPGLVSERIFAVWGLDFVLAFAIGIAFQYFAIAPMRGLGPAEGLKAAVKADAASLTAWQVGMYGLMAIAHFWLFRQVLDAEVDATTPLFWFAMQLAMMAGFVTAYPVNWWLIRAGIKEAM